MWATSCTFIACYGWQIKEILFFLYFFYTNFRVGRNLFKRTVLYCKQSSCSVRGRNPHHWSTVGDHNAAVSSETHRILSENVIFFIGDPQIFIGNSKIFIGDPKTFHCDPKWGSLKTRQWWSPIKRGFRQYSNDENFFTTLFWLILWIVWKI